MDALDWSAPELLDALNADNINGFGFQCDREQSAQPTRMYVAQPFNVRHQNGSLSRDADYVPAWRDGDDEDLELVRQALPADIPRADVWITDYLGRNFVTVHTRQYLNLPRIIDTFLACGFCMVTHTAVKVCFKPGEHFSRLALERKTVETMRSEYEEWKRLRPQDDNPWNFMLKFIRVFPLIQHWNWATPEGRALCDELRRAQRKKRPRCKHEPRMLWPKYAEVAQRYGILHLGGWSAYDTGLAVPMEHSQEAEDEDGDEVLCMDCMSEPPDTIAQPCGHIAVCHTCSDQLAVTQTVNKTRCIQCQRPITHVEK